MFGFLDDPFPIAKGHYIFAILRNIGNLAIFVLIVNLVCSEEEWIFRVNFINTRCPLDLHLFTTFCKMRAYESGYLKVKTVIQTLCTYPE